MYRVIEKTHTNIFYIKIVKMGRNTYYSFIFLKVYKKQIRNEYHSSLEKQAMKKFHMCKTYIFPLLWQFQKVMAKHFFSVHKYLINSKEFTNIKNLSSYEVGI